MSQFYIIFFGLYITLFATPLVAFVLRKKLEPNIRLLFGLAGITLILFCFATGFGLSLSGTEADVVVFYAIYLVLGLCVFQLVRLKHVIFKTIGSLCTVPFIIFPLLSIPAVLGVALVIGDYETKYSVYDGSHLCRVTSYGNATTSTGGYEAIIYKRFGFVEYKVDFVAVDNTQKPEITPESVCNAALSKLKS
jgi:hypothetical protein